MFLLCGLITFTIDKNNFDDPEGRLSGITAADAENVFSVDNFNQEVDKVREPGLLPQ